MFSEWFWPVFEIAVNLFETFIIIEFPSSFLGYKIHGKKKILLFLAAFSLSFITITVENTFGIFEIWETFITIGITFVYSVFCLKGSIVKKLIVSVVSREVIAILNSLIILIMGFVLDIPFAEIFEVNDFTRLITMIVSKIVYFFATRGIIYFGNLLKGRFDGWQLLITGVNLLLSTVAGEIIILMITYNSYSETELYQLFFIAVCIWIMCFITYFLIIKMRKESMVKAENNLLKQEQKYQRENMKSLEVSNSEVQSLKHDLKHHVSMMVQTLKAGNTETAIEQGEALCGKIDTVYTINETGNVSVDAILNTMVAKSRNMGIDVKCTIFCDLSSVPPLEFSSIIGNLLDNSIEACEKLPPEKRRIELEITSPYGMVHLVVRNSIMESVLQKNRELQTSKSNPREHGIGSKSVRQIVKKLGGTIHYYEEWGMFVCDIICPKNM